jgi:hypothetical protein
VRVFTDRSCKEVVVELLQTQNMVETILEDERVRRNVGFKMVTILLGHVSRSSNCISGPCRFPTTAARVRTQVRTCGICGGRSGTGAGFLRVLWFPLTILIPPPAPHSLSSIIRGWFNRPISGRHTKWTQSHPKPKKLKK